VVPAEARQKATVLEAQGRSATILEDGKAYHVLPFALPKQKI